MIVKESDRRAPELSGTSALLLGVSVITVGFLSPAPLSIQILIALSVTFVMTVVEHIQNKIELSQKESFAHFWLDTLVLRLAINEALSNARGGRYDTIQWQRITQEAVEDIKSVQQADELHEQISTAGRTERLIGLASALLMMLVFPGSGYLIAMLIKMFVPGMSEGL